MMASTHLETEGSASERRLYIWVYYGVFYMHQYNIYNRLPEGKLSGSKHIEDIK